MTTVSDELPASNLATRQLGFLLPASTAMRGLAFEKLARFALAAADVAKPLTGAFGVNLGRPGQWDGLVSAGGDFILDAKASLSPLYIPSKLDRRIEEARAAGLSGVILVFLRRSEPLQLPLTLPVRAFSLCDLVPEPEAGSAMLPTGDILRFRKWGAAIGKGKILFGSLPIARRVAPATLLDDRYAVALARAAMIARAGSSVALAEVPPFGAAGGEAGILWTCEDCLRGLYAPPASVLRGIFAGEGALDLDDLPGRLYRNLVKILTHCGRLRMPTTKQEARIRVKSYPPLKYWESMRRRRDFNGACRAITEAYAAYRGYADNLFNANKCRACERFISATSVQ